MPLVLGGLLSAGVLIVGWVLLADALFQRKCEKWCAKRGLKCLKIDLKDGGYGYVAHDPERMRWYQIPQDFGEIDEAQSIGARMQEFDWKGSDKVAVEKDGRVIPLDFVKKDEEERRV